MDAIDNVDVGREVGDLDRQIKSADFREQELFRALDSVADTPRLRFAIEDGVEVLDGVVERLYRAFPYNVDVFHACMDRLTSLQDALEVSLEHADLRNEAWKEIRETQEHKRRLTLAKSQKDAKGDAIRRELIETVATRLVAVVSSIVEDYVTEQSHRREAGERLTGAVSAFLPGIVAGDPAPVRRLLEAD